jgi:hypothetical protein
MDEIDIAEGCAWAVPHAKRFDAWKNWVVWDDGCDEDGNWIGFCRLHDTEREHEGSAEYNFIKNVMRCSGSCHPGKRAVSLDNVLTRSNASG